MAIFWIKPTWKVIKFAINSHFGQTWQFFWMYQTWQLFEFFCCYLEFSVHVIVNMKFINISFWVKIISLTGKHNLFQPIPKNKCRHGEIKSYPATPKSWMFRQFSVNLAVLPVTPRLKEGLKSSLQWTSNFIIRIRVAKFVYVKIDNLRKP